MEGNGRGGGHKMKLEGWAVAKLEMVLYAV